MSEGVKAVYTLKALVKNAEAQKLTKLLQDTHRFILSNRQLIEIAPLQVYASTLMFSPKYSLIRQLFKKEQLDWVALKLRVEAEWDAYLQTLEGYGNVVISVVFSADS